MFSPIFKANYRKTLLVVNGIWGLVCLFVIAFMIGICTFWLAQPQFFYSITNSSVKPHVVSSEGDIYHPNILITGTGKAEYYQWIENRKGETVHEYAKVNLDTENNSSIRQERVTIPRLPKGIYIIKGKMISRPNPLKQMMVSIIIGVIQVKDKNEEENEHNRITTVINDDRK